MMNWGINLFISFLIPNVILWIGDDNVGYIFIFFAATSFFGTIFIKVFMYETMGKSQQEIEDMFNMDKDHLELRKAKSSNPDMAYSDVSVP